MAENQDRGTRKAQRIAARQMSVRRPRSRTGMWISIGAVTIVALIAIGVSVAWFMVTSTGSTSVAKGKQITFEIPMGAGTEKIGSILLSEGVIGNEALFRVIARVERADGHFKAGIYRLPAQSSYGDIIDALRKGPEQVFVTVTIPEGLTVAQTAVIVQEKTGISAEEFEVLAKSGATEFGSKFPFLEGAYSESLEGYLFPDTYRIDENASARDVIEMMLEQFDEVWSEISISKSRAKQYSPHEIVTIASLVEREARIEKERPLVASVVDNRLKKHMKLQFCSTVQFLLPGEEERTKIRLTNADISIPSPYNTYQNQGLPPGPIANPGKASLLAAAKPANTTYIFFVLTGKDGSQTFATTSDEFLRAKALSKKVLGQ